MPETQTQLRDYWTHLDELCPEIELEDVVSPAAAASPLAQGAGWRQSPWRKRLLAAGAAAALVLAAIGGTALLVGGDPAGPPAVSDPPATVPPTTTPPPTTPPPTATGLETGSDPVVGYVWDPAVLSADQFTEQAVISSVAYTGSLFVAAGRVVEDCAQVWVSADGVVWDGAPNAGGGVSVPCRAHVHDVASNGILSVAVGQKDNAPATWVSEDSHEWRLLDPGLLPGEPQFGEGGETLPVEILSVSASERGFVAVGSAIWFSADGREWVEASAPPVDRLEDVTSRPDGFQAVGSLVGSPSAVLYSADGRDWSVVANLSGTTEAGEECWVALNAVTYGPAGHVTAGDCVPQDATVAYSSMWWSDDGLTWTQIPHDETAFGEPAYITSIVSDERGYLAAGWTLDATEQRATVWFSEDAVNWTRTELNAEGNSGISDVVLHDGMALAVGRSAGKPAVWVGSQP